jgi:hypothetical protein
MDRLSMLRSDIHDAIKYGVDRLLILPGAIRIGVELQPNGTIILKVKTQRGVEEVYRVKINRIV